MEIFKTLTPVYHLNLYIHQPVLMNFFPLRSVWSSFGQYLPQFTWTFPPPFYCPVLLRRGKEVLCQFLRGGCGSCVFFCHYILHLLHVYLSCLYWLDLWPHCQVQTLLKEKRARHSWAGPFISQGPGYNFSFLTWGNRNLTRWGDLSMSHSWKLD